MLYLNGRDDCLLLCTKSTFGNEPKGMNFGYLFVLDPKLQIARNNSLFGDQKTQKYVSLCVDIDRFAWRIVYEDIIKDKG